MVLRACAREARGRQKRALFGVRARDRPRTMWRILQVPQCPALMVRRIILRIMRLQTPRTLVGTSIPKHSPTNRRFIKRRIGLWAR